MATSGFLSESIVPSNAEFERFKEDLVRELNKHTIGLDSKTHFLPASGRRALVTYKTLRLLFPSSDESSIRWLLDKAPKVFLITALSLPGYREVVHALHDFSRHQFDDCQLPIVDFTNAHENGLCDCSRVLEDRTADNNENLPCRYEIFTKAFAPPCWDLLSKRRFFNEQWSFLVQEFDTSTFEYDLENERIVPLTMAPRSNRRTLGTFGHVVAAKMLTEFLTTHEETPDQESFIEVAVKTLISISEPSYDIETEFQREIHANRALSKVHHQNIVHALAAYRHRGEYNLVFEWADGGSLRQFLAENVTPCLTPSIVLEVLEQLRGLADALNHLHKPKSIRARVQKGLSLTRREIEQSHDTDAASTRIPRIPVSRDDDVLPMREVPRSLEQDGDTHWRHGDIKPENILRFKSDRSWLGTLKLADFGRAKAHQTATNFRPNVEFDRWRTKSYEPPDVFVENGERQMSRFYDIWSLGCVYLEVLTWLIGGKNVMDYETTENIAASEGTPFWTKVGTERAVISQTASLSMTTLRNSPICQDDSAIGDVTKLIQDKMLVVALPEQYDQHLQGYRGNAEAVSIELTRIVDRARTEQAYLLSEAPLMKVSLNSSTESVQIAIRNRSGSAIRPPALTELRAPSPQRNYHQEHRQRNIRKSKSHNAIITDLRARSIADNNITLMMPKLNHITLTKSNMTTQFTHSLRDTWHYENDDIFAQKILHSICDNERSITRLYADQYTELCDACVKFDPASPTSFQTRSLSSLRRASEDCDLCEYLFRLADKAGLLSTHEVSLARDGGLMKINNRHDMRMRICRSANSQRRTDTVEDDIPIGLPKLDRVAKSVHFNIVRHWLEDCDDRHGNCAPKWPMGYCPKRLLYFGENDECRLVETQSLGRRREFLKYAALSHPWGLPQQHHHFKSTKTNCFEFLAAIEPDRLPANYQDAIRVCRAALGIHYLWIDSICILQAADGDAGDFHDEAAFIQDIFANAYCVIAASSARGTSSGFLKPRKPSEPLCLPRKSRNGSQDGKYYISDVLDDFENDVLDGPLTERGWVMQERALARRTLFFTANQTYFECRQGIRCESLSRMRCDRAAFLGDSNFPDFGISHKFSAQLYLITALYEQYSALRFTHYVDKPIAISGMELRLTKSFGTRSGAGIFLQHQGRWLLWHRAESVKTLVRIEFPDATFINKPPSWSFMSYIGAITYIVPPSSQITWNDQIRLTLTGDWKTMWLYTKGELEMKSRILTFADDDAKKFTQVNEETRSRAEQALHEIYIILDDPNTSSEPIKTFVLVGTLRLGRSLGARSYVLAVRHVSGSESVYERVGAGWLPEWLIDRAWLTVRYCLVR